MLSMAQGSGLVGETQWPVVCGKVTIEDPEVLSELKVLKFCFLFMRRNGLWLLC